MYKFYSKTIHMGTISISCLWVLNELYSLGGNFYISQMC